MTAPKDRPYRDLAADWHGGQWSPLYAYASTGSIIDGLVREIDECIAMRQSTAYDTYPIDAESDLEQLRAFRDFVLTEMENA